ncbi:MAG: hypothetical protein J2P57_09950, partial [Acidimicrobiaceae bacterium]|nr:hypothetical protein [Acidimicrobiaceae bacterium]
AEAAEGWLRRAAAATPLPWPSALAPDGAPLPDREELGLQGWRRSQPVVTGKDLPGVQGTVQMDLYGDVVAAVTSGGPLSAAWEPLAAAADWVADHWQVPSISSALQAWFALDRMTRLARAANPLDLQAVVWQQTAAEILRGIEREGMSEAAVDAALLRVAWRGPWPPHHPLVASTVDRVLLQLSSGLLVYRQGEQVDDSPDLTASLWAVRALTRLDRWEEAHERMDAVVSLGGDLGVLAEAADPLSGELLGNLPSASAHLALIDAAIALAAGPR